MLELHVHQTPVLSHPNSPDWVSPPGDSGFQLWDNRLTREKGPAVSEDHTVGRLSQDKWEVSSAQKSTQGSKERGAFEWGGPLQRLLLIHLLLAALDLHCCMGFSLQRAEAPLHCSASAPHSGGFSWCGAEALLNYMFSSCAWAQEFWCIGFIAPQHVGSSTLGTESMSPALAGGFLTISPPEKPCKDFWQHSHKEAQRRNQKELLYLQRQMCFHGEQVEEKQNWQSGTVPSSA